MLLRYLDLWKQKEKNTAFLRTTIDKNSDCQDWKQKNKPGKIVELVGFTVVPKIKSCKSVIIQKDN